MAQWSYAVTHYDIDTAVATSITSDVIAIPKFTDTGSGEVNSARLIISANNGNHITNGVIIDEFDRIRIVSNDGLGGTYDTVFDVVKIIPIYTKSTGTRLELVLLGLEHHLQKINYAKPVYYDGAKEVIEDLGNTYNANRGTKQPELIGHLKTDNTNQLPSASQQNNTYDFGINQEFIYNRMIEVADKQGGSVDSGGVLDFFDIKFKSKSANHTQFEFNGFSSGSPTDGSEVTISQSNSVNVGESESGIDNITGSVIHAWGAPDQGSIPVSFSKFQSAERRYSLYPQWSSTIEYKVNAKVQYQGLVWTRNNFDVVLPANPPTSDVNWSSATRAQDYGNIYQYSPWTDNNVAMWRDAACDPTNINSSGEIGPSFNDSNIVIHDTEAPWFRTWVYVRVTTANPQPSDITGDLTLKKYLYNQTDFYRGFRVMLMNSASTGTWSGNDKNGKPFARGILEYDGVDWVVKYDLKDKLVCAVRHEGVSYTYNQGTTTWSAEGMSTAGDWVHPYNSIVNAAGIPGIGDGTFTLNSDSAVKVTYEFATIIPSATDLHRGGAWLNFMFPAPNAELIGTTDVGFWYGGKKKVAGVPDADKEPATFDIQNMHLTHDGFKGFNNGESSEDFGQCSSIDFWMNINYQGANGGPFVTGTEANFKMTCIIVDTSDNMVAQDFVIPFNNHWDSYKLPVSGFKTYRGRKPLETILDSIIVPKGMDINNIFQWRNIKQIIWQTAESYDSQGRYTANFALGNRYFTAYMSLDGVTTPVAQKRIDLSIDALRFTKPLLVNTGSDSTRNIEGEFLERPEIFDYFQLKSDANAELEKRKFRHVEYEINTTGKHDIEMGDYFIYERDNIIPGEFETTPGSKKIKLVAKRIEYSITKPVKGKGGFLRKILGVRRFV